LNPLTTNRKKQQRVLNMIDWVDAEMTKWGECVRGGDRNLGYPGSSVEARMQDGQLTQSKRKTPALVYLPEEVVRTEEIILAMPHELQAVAIVAYTTNGDRHEQARILSRRLGRTISKRSFVEKINFLHHRYEAWSQAMNVYQRKLASGQAGAGRTA